MRRHELHEAVSNLFRATSQPQDRATYLIDRGLKMAVSEQVEAVREGIEDSDSLEDFNASVESYHVSFRVERGSFALIIVVHIGGHGFIDHHDFDKWRKSVQYLIGGDISLSRSGHPVIEYTGKIKGFSRQIRV